MTPRNIGIVLDQGADFKIVLGIFGMDGPIDITGYSFIGEMKSSTDPLDPVIAEFQFEILNQYSSKGLVSMTLPSEVIDNVVASVSNPLQKDRLLTPFVYDVKQHDSNGDVKRIMQGIAYLSPEASSEEF